MISFDETRDVVRKQAENRAERGRLAREAAVLRVAAHPGIVQLVAAEGDGDPEALVLRRVQGPSLKERGALPPAELGQMGAAVATTLADLHDIGVVHRALEPEHVLMDDAGRPVLCGFGSACRATQGEDLDAWRRDDVKALAGLLIEADGSVLGSKTAAMLHAAAAGRDRTGWRGATIDARFIASTLAALAPAAGPARGERRRTAQARPALSRRRPARGRPARGRFARGRPGVGARFIPGGVAAAGALALVVTLWTVSRTPPAPARLSQPAELRSAVTPCPVQDDGCAPIAALNGTVGLGFRILGAAGVTVLGRWDCRAVATPAVLDPATGDVWVFDTWPKAGQQTAGRLVAPATGGSSLDVVPARGSTACDRIRIDRHGRRSLVVTPDNRSRG